MWGNIICLLLGCRMIDEVPKSCPRHFAETMQIKHNIITLVYLIFNGSKASHLPPSSAHFSTTATMATKATDPEAFLAQIESLLRYHESSNNTDKIPVYDGPLGDRQAAVLKTLDGLIMKRKDERKVCKMAEEDRIWRDPNPGAATGTGTVRQ